MSAARRAATMARVGAVAALALALAACAYDYRQRTDRVGFSAGNAVHANLEGQTANPSDRARYRTTGLGRNGAVLDSEEPPAPAASP